ncbi:uncharacterized protein [Typha latifolia]|uniref:uncharacterized protein n=1 Tax=Typha latifolia TaxID=4733 RepID=UPI003C2CEFA7
MPPSVAGDATSVGCCVFLRWPSSASWLGYRPLDCLDDGEETAVRVVVGKERRVFLVEPFVLDKDPFRVLMEMVVIRKEGKHKDVIFVDVDAILFEHMLWLVYHESSASSSSLFQLNLREIIEFYSQDT